MSLQRSPQSTSSNISSETAYWVDSHSELKAESIHKGIPNVQQLLNQDNFKNRSKSTKSSQLANSFLDEIDQLIEGPNPTAHDVPPQTVLKATKMIRQMGKLADCLLDNPESDRLPRGFVSTVYTAGDSKITAIKFLTPTKTSHRASRSKISQICSKQQESLCPCGQVHVSPDVISFTVKQPPLPELSKCREPLKAAKTSSHSILVKT